MSETKAQNGTATLTPEDVVRLFEDGYRDVEVLPDGTVREVPRDGDALEDVTRTLKTERTWY
ncbi:MAG TPA: hypothetical protein VGB51_11095 [Actinomycetota bacterium]